MCLAYPVYALPTVWCAYHAWDVFKALSKSAEQLQFQVHVVASGLLLGGVCGAFFGKQMKQHLFRVSGMTDQVTSGGGWDPLGSFIDSSCRAYPPLPFLGRPSA